MKKALFFLAVGACFLFPTSVTAQAASQTPAKGAPFFTSHPKFYWNDGGKTLSVGFSMNYQDISQAAYTPVSYGISVARVQILTPGDTSYPDYQLVCMGAVNPSELPIPDSLRGPSGEGNLVILPKTFAKDSLYLITLILKDDSGSCTYEKVVRSLDGAPLGISDQVLSNFSVFPNPFSNFLSITTEETQGGLRITDLTGREIYESQLQNGTSSIPMDVPAGIYIATVTDSKGIRETKRISKE